ncbi:MAG TPA: NPCBM/NEW2 domain-containing protein [Pirellulales bacterium]|nr:NPCBM/NEW2 domain-containing protein [Pirellulales bacterium]
MQTSDGEQFYGRLTALSAKQVALETQPGPVTLSFDDVADITPLEKPAAPAERPSVWIDLVDGSRLLGASYEVSAGRAKIKLLDQQVVELSTRAVAGVRLIDTSGAQAAQWATIAEAERTGDLIVIRGKTALDYQAGVLGDITAETVGSKLDDEALSVKRTKVAGLLYYHPAGKKLPRGFAQLVDAGGSRLEIAEARLAADRLTIKTPAGFERTVPLDQIAAVTGRVQYLSDLEPESALWTPYASAAGQPDSLARLFRPRRNEAVDGGELKLDGISYAKGLAMYSRSEVVYRLPPGQFKRLKAVAGIDDRAQPAGAVRLVILGDDRKLLEAEVAADQEPLPVDLDLSGVRRLRILVDFGPRAEAMDLFDLCEARILQ